mgnify:CR=1 FL=1
MAEDFININLDEVDDGTDPLPEGPCPIFVKAAEWKHKAGSAYPYLNIEMKPRPGAVEEKLKNKSLFLTLSMNPKALWNMKLFFKATKMPSDLRGMKPDEIARMIQGREAVVSVGLRPSQRDPEKQDNEVKPPYHAVR